MSDSLIQVTVGDSPTPTFTQGTVAIIKADAVLETGFHTHSVEVTDPTGLTSILEVFSAETLTSPFLFDLPGAYRFVSTYSDASGKVYTSQPVSVSVTAKDQPTSFIVKINGQVGPTLANVGVPILVEGSVHDDNGINSLWLEIRSPANQWSWEGFLTKESYPEWFPDDYPDVRNDATRSASIILHEPGAYTVRATAYDVKLKDWLISTEYALVVQAILVSDGPPPPPPPPVPPPTDDHPVYEPLPTVVKPDGTIDPVAYKAYWSNWSQDTWSERLGPTYEGTDKFPVNNGPTDHIPAPQYWGRINPYELGPDGGPGEDPSGDYWSESAQTIHIPDDPTHCGVSRSQVFAYYNLVFAISPRYDISGGDRDFFGDYGNYKQVLGHFAKRAIASSRCYGLLSNEALIVTSDGLLGSGLTQTSRGGEDWPLPILKLPDGLVPTAIAQTSSNELAFISVWNTNEVKGQVAVVALQGKCLSSHTMHAYCQPNEGSWSGFKLLGLVDLPFATPSSISAAVNSTWGGPSQTNSQDLGQIDLDNPEVRKGMLSGDPQWTSVFATKGYAIVASKLENKVSFLDLTKLMTFIRESYLAYDDTVYKQVMADEEAGKFPPTFQENPDITPTVVTMELPRPTAVLAAPQIDRWSHDYFKAYVACEDGNVHIIDTSPYMARFDWHVYGTLGETGSVHVGKNPIGMCFARFKEGPGRIPEAPPTETLDGHLNLFYVACRGDRSVKAVCTFHGQGWVYRELKDDRILDPVNVSVAGRGNIVTITDFKGKAIHNFRIGSLGRYVDDYQATYLVDNNGNDFDYAGKLALTGSPIAHNSANVN